MTDVFLPALLHGLPDAVVAIDDQSVVQVWNGGAARLVGVDEKSAVGRALDELVGGELRLGRLRAKDGRVIAVSVDVVAFDEGDGGSLHQVFIVREASGQAVSLLDRLDVGEALPPRLRETLAGLVEGLSEKELAAHMKLSQHTVHDYVKALYRRLGVQSRAELIAQVLRTALHDPRAARVG